MYLSSIKLVVNTQRKQEKVEAIGGGRERFSVMGCQCMEWKKKREEESGSLCHAGSAAVVLSLHLAVKAQQCIYHMLSFKCDSLLCENAQTYFSAIFGQ